jgi:hypothetical protein
VAADSAERINPATVTETVLNIVFLPSGFTSCHSAARDNLEGIAPASECYLMSQDTHSPEEVPDVAAEEAQKKMARAWRKWIAGSRYRG